jgi:hypothetical protein
MALWAETCSDSYAQWNMSELFGTLLCLTGKTKLVYSTNTEQDAFLKDYYALIWEFSVNDWAAQVEETDAFLSSCLAEIQPTIRTINARAYTHYTFS